jgi:hypothetical protein
MTTTERHHRHTSPIAARGALSVYHLAVAVDQGVDAMR